MKQLMMGFAACMLLMTSCTEQDITETVLDGQGQLTFSTGIGKQTTKTAELTNFALRNAADDELTGIKLRTYQDLATNRTFTEWFDDVLWHNGTEWKIKTTRFRNTVPTKFITYFPKSDRLAEVLGSFEAADFKTEFPKFTYEVNTRSNNQEDLIAGVTEIAANQSDITIGLRHILSQVNFGTKGYSGANISIRNINIKGLYNSATYTYDKEDKYPIGAWGTYLPNPARDISYEYFNYKNEDDNTDLNPHPSVASAANTGDIYIFGDGGKWGPGKEINIFYPDVNDNGAWINYVSPQDSLTNSLMLMPQDFMTDAPNAKVTFEYRITDEDSAFVAGGPGDVWAEGEFKLNFETGTESGKHYLGKWEQNYRYLYLIDFTDFLDGSALTFKVDVDMYPWENYDGDGGIIDIMVAGQPRATDMNDKDFTNGDTWYIASQDKKNPTTEYDPWKWAQVVKDEIWNLSTYDFTQMEIGNTFTLSFLNVIFNTSEKPSTGIPTKITLTLPEGFSAINGAGIIMSGTTPDYLIREGDRSATATIEITNDSYYRTSAKLKAAIDGATENGKTLYYGGKEAIDLKTMEPVALSTVGNTFSVKFNSLIIPTVGATNNGIWTWNATLKTATWTKVTWNSLSDAKTAVTDATADATIYCSDATDITSLATTFGEPTNTGVSTIKVVFNATADRTGDATDNGAWTYDAKSKTATWTKTP